MSHISIQLIYCLDWAVSATSLYSTWSKKNSNEFVHNVNLSHIGCGKLVSTLGHMNNDKINGTSDRKWHCGLNISLLHTKLSKEANNILGCRMKWSDHLIVFDINQTPSDVQHWFMGVTFQKEHWWVQVLSELIKCSWKLAI